MRTRKGKLTMDEAKELFGEIPPERVLAASIIAFMAYENEPKDMMPLAARYGVTVGDYLLAQKALRSGFGEEPIQRPPYKIM